MRTLFIVVGLLCLCGLPVSRACRRKLLVNVDFPGTDIKTLYSPDAQHCQYLCTQHATCLFFSFLRHDWTGDNRRFFCFLKSTSNGQPKLQRAVKGITSGFSLKKPCPPDPQPCLPQVYNHTDFPGADYRTFFTTDYKECQAACTSDPACQFFTYLNQAYAGVNYRHKCHLKFSWTIPRIPTITRASSGISGFSQRIKITQNYDTACEEKLFPNTNIPGHNVEVLPAASAEHCQALCTAHSTCTYFTYVSHNFKCHLKHQPGKMVKRVEKGCISGLPARFCQLKNDWIKKVYVGIDFPQSDIRSLLTDSAESCQRSCTEDSTCQFYTFNTNKRRCYHKSVVVIPAPPKVTKLQNVVSGFSLRNCC